MHSTRRRENGQFIYEYCYTAENVCQGGYLEIIRLEMHENENGKKINFFMNVLIIFKQVYFVKNTFTGKSIDYEKLFFFRVVINRRFVNNPHF